MMEDVPYSPDMSYADLLRMAIKNEEKSQRLYTSTAQLVTESRLKKLLLILAQEESTHKERLEKIYEKEILQEFWMWMKSKFQNPNVKRMSKKEKN